MKTKTKLAAGILALCMAANFSGCAGNGSASSQTNTAPSSSSSAASSQKDTLKGSVTIYTSQPEQDIQALIQAFNKKQPEIKVNVFRSGTEEVVSKILAEKRPGR